MKETVTQLEENGISFVRVERSYPNNTATFVGDFGGQSWSYKRSLEAARELSNSAYERHMSL